MNAPSDSTAMDYTHNPRGHDSNATGGSARLPASRDYRIVWWVVALIVLLQACYAAGFIYRTSFVIEGQRYFCLFDDAMISMCYAQNWAQGEGLVWNAGERVEGYTNFGWTAILALCHLLGFSPAYTCLLVQILGIPTLWGCLVGATLLARACRLLPVSAICALILTATYYNLIFFSLLGMETGLLCCLFTFGLYECAKSLQCREGRMRALLWFAPAVLVRIDALLIAIYVCAYLALTVRKKRARLLLGLLVVLAVMLVHAVCRHYYYGQWLPNTYHLKATGWPLFERLEAGLEHTAWSAASLGVPFVMGLASMLAFKRWHLLLLGPFVLSVAYQIYVGGDAWPLSRFLIPTTIGMFVLSAQGIQRLLMLFVERKAQFFGKSLRVGLTLLLVFAINALHWDHYLFLLPPQMTYGNVMNLRFWRAVESIADAEASVALGWAGALPYYSQRKCYDLLGKCDPYIAHLPVVPGADRAGHNKYDFAYSLSHHKPDIILHVYMFTEPEFAQNYHARAVDVDGERLALFVRNNSPYIHGGIPLSLKDAADINRGIRKGP